MNSTDWSETKYRETFEDELRGLRRRLASDPTCGAESLAGTLRHLYEFHGQDWGGRGEVQNISLEATIAAYELVIHELTSAEKKKRDMADSNSPPTA